MDTTPEAPAPLPVFSLPGPFDKLQSHHPISFHVCCTVLELTRKAQRQNGVQKQDFMRYRQYCSRRLTRLRKTLKMTHSRRNFQKFAMSDDKVVDSRSLMLPLMYAERAWAYAMDLKREQVRESC